MKTAMLVAMMAVCGVVFGPQSARAQARALCDALDLAQSLDLADGPASVFFDSLPKCTSTDPSALYYQGSGPIEGTLSDLTLIPFVTQGAYFCGIADAHDTPSHATFDALGKFGVESRFRVTRRDPAQGRIDAERTGEIFLFGASAILERQDMVWTVPAEVQAENFGGYVQLRATQGSWDWTPGKVSFPVAIVGAGSVFVTLGLELHGRTPVESMRNNLIAPAITPPFQFSRFQSCLMNGPTCGPNLCESACGPNLPNPYLKYVFDRFNDCPGHCGSLGDGILPYIGTFGGASGYNGAYIYMSPFRSWIHLGRVGGSVDRVPPAESFLAPPAEPVALLNVDNFASLRNHATTWGKLDLEVSYEAAVASITVGTTTTLAVRDGFAVRQRDMPATFDPGGASGLRDVIVQTAIDSQAALDVDARIRVVVNLPIGRVDARFEIPNIVHRKRTPGETTATRLGYRIDPATRNTHSALNRYEVRGAAKSNPEQARLDCQFDSSAPTRRAATAVPNPSAFLKDVAKRSIDAVHPCNVHFCAGGEVHDCNWNASSKSLECRTSPGCPSVRNNCWDRLELCDASGSVIPNTRWEFDDNFDEGVMPNACIQ